MWRRRDRLTRELEKAMRRPISAEELAEIDACRGERLVVKVPETVRRGRRWPRGRRIRPF